MVNIEQSKMQMASELERMKFEDSSYFWKERTKEIVIEVEIVVEIVFFTHGKIEKVVGD
jgi:hypothetical protein